MSSTSLSVKSTTRKVLELSRINRVNAEFGISPYLLPRVKAVAKFCPPPVVNDKAATVTAPAASGQGVGSSCQRSALISGNAAGLVGTSLDTVVAHVSTSPDSLMPSRIAAFSTAYAIQHETISDTTPIATENKNALPIASLNAASMGSPVVVPSIIRTLPGLGKSNLDLNGRLVKKGALVSWHGFRGRIVRVRMGTAYPERGSPLQINVGAFVSCKSVQVVQ